MPIPIILADEQTSFRAGAAHVLHPPEFAIASQPESPAALAATLQARRDCVVLLSGTLLETAATERQIAAAAPFGHRFILLTDNEAPKGPAWRSALHGAVRRNTSIDNLLDCVRRVAAGERTPFRRGTSADDGVSGRVLQELSERELQMIGLVTRGQTNREIAAHLRTTEQVVKNYLRGVFDKTGVSDRLELALFTLHHQALAVAAAKAIGEAKATGEAKA